MGLGLADELFVARYCFVELAFIVVVFPPKLLDAAWLAVGVLRCTRF